MCRIHSALRIGLLMVLGMTPYLVSAQTARGRPPELGPPATLVAILDGTQLEPGLWSFSIEAGPVAKLAMVFYSEPSHKLIGLVVDRKFRDSEKGAAWLEKTLHAFPEATVEAADLPDQPVKIQLSKFAERDERFSLWVLNDWSDGKQELRRITVSRPIKERLDHGYVVELSGRHIVAMSADQARRVAGHPDRWSELEN